VKIDNTNPERGTNAIDTAAVERSRTSDAKLAQQSADVEDAAEVSSIAQLASKLSDSSQARIQELREQVRSGSYSVDAPVLSEKIIKSAIDE
jgi:anti-sigma28 factor (negative regulator of flagellin synthesis)